MSEKEIIRKEIKSQLDFIDPKSNPYNKGRWNELNHLLLFIDSMQEEPVSEDLEEAAMMHYKDVMERKIITGLETANMTSFKTGAKWQKEQLMAKAVDGEVGYWNQRGLSVLMSLPREFEEDDKCKIILIKEE